MRAKYTVAFLTALFSLNCAAARPDLPMEYFSMPIGGESINVPPIHDFGRPIIDSDRPKVIWVDTLVLISTSIWKADCEPIPLAMDQALSLAYEKLVASVAYLKKSHLFSFSLNHVFGDAAEDVWYYDIVFDASRRSPMPQNGSKYMEIYRSVVLLDGTVLTPMARTYDEISENFATSCTYKRVGGKWQKLTCTRKQR